MRPRPGAATSVSGPLSTTTQSNRWTAACTLASRRAAMSLDGTSRSRASSPSCGVSTRGPGQSAGSSWKSASASTTTGSSSCASSWRTSSCGPGPRPRPGPSATAVARSASSRTVSVASLGDEPRLVGQRPLHHLEQALFERRQGRLRHCDGDIAGVGAHRCPGGERRGAGEPARAADDEHVARRVLVVALASPRDREQELRGREPGHRLVLLEADVGDVDPTGVEAARRDDEAELAPVEGSAICRALTFYRLLR